MPDPNLRDISWALIPGGAFVVLAVVFGVPAIRQNLRDFVEDNEILGKVLKLREGEKKKSPTPEREV